MNDVFPRNRERAAGFINREVMERENGCCRFDLRKRRRWESERVGEGKLDIGFSLGYFSGMKKQSCLYF